MSDELPTTDTGLTTGTSVNAVANRLESVELLEALLSLVPDAAVVVDEAGGIVSANAQAESLFGYALDELKRLRVEALIPDRYRREHRRHRLGYGAARQARPMGAGLELTGRRRDGSEFPLDISLAPVSGGGRPLIIAAVRDATDRQAATAAQAQLAAIVQTSVVAIISTTVDGRITSWNPAAEKMFGFPAERIVGRQINALVPDDLSAEYAELLAAALAGEFRAARDTQWLHRDGTRLDIALSMSPLHDAGGRLLGFSAVLRDITMRKRAETELHRLLAEERRQERWQSATAEIRLSLLAGSPVQDSLTVICRWATELLDADRAALLVTDGAELRLVADSGTRGPRPHQSPPAELAVAGRVIASGRMQALARDPPAGPGLGVPVISDRGLQGVLVVLRRDGGAAFGSEAALVAEGLAEQAALSLELSDARLAHERLLLVVERERIARDLHDLVIQRLFATGIGLQSVLRLVDDPRAGDRISQSIEDLDTTIREIRSTIFALETPLSAASGLRVEILKLASRASEGLGYEPVVRFDGPIDSTVPDLVIPHVLAVAREALSNVARHAQAGHVELDLSVGDGNVVLRVVDDGVGMGPARRESGLANLRERAHGFGGSLRIVAPSSGGTELEWAVPLPV